MQWDVDLWEFVDVWPTDLPPPKKIAACVWWEPTLHQGAHTGTAGGKIAVSIVWYGAGQVGLEGRARKSVAPL